jgi:hypothetical protein
METEDIWHIWEIFSNYIPNKEKEDAIDEFLLHLYETDACEISDLRACADDYNDELFSKAARRFIRDNGLDEEEYD